MPSSSRIVDEAARQVLRPRTGARPSDSSSISSRSRPAHQRAGDGQHLPLAARQQPA